MKKRGWIVALCTVALLLPGCTGGGSTTQTAGRAGESAPTTQREGAQSDQPKIWTHPQLAALSNGEKFIPSHPTDNNYILVMSQDNQYEDKSGEQIDDSQINVQMGGALELLLQLEDAKKLTSKATLEPYLQALGISQLERLPLTMTKDPHQAKYILEYKVSYPSFREYENTQDPDKKDTRVDVYACRLELKLLESVSGKELGVMVLVNDSQGNVNLIHDATKKVYREIPGLYDGEAAKNLMGLLTKAG